MANLLENSFYHLATQINGIQTKLLGLFSMGLWLLETTLTLHIVIWVIVNLKWLISAVYIHFVSNSASNVALAVSLHWLGSETLLSF